jgi:serine/threonine protein kinase
MAEFSVSVVLGVLGLTSACLDVIDSGYVVADRKDDIRALAFRLNIEAYLLARWAENIGILQSDIDPNGPKRLSKHDMVEGILKRVLSLFDQSSEFIAKYEGSKSLEPIPRLNRRSTTSSKIIQLAKHKRLTSIPQAIKWAVRDGKQFEKLVSEISTLLKYLFRLVPEDPELLKRQLFVDTLPASQEADLDTLAHLNIGQDGDDEAVESAVKFLSHAARIRSALPIWGVNQALSSTGFEQPPVKMPKLASQLPLSLARWPTSMEIEDTSESIPVVVEWRWTEQIAEARPDEQLLFKHDVARLTKLLSLASQWPQYHTLQCLGYFVDDEYGQGQSGPRYGIIFEGPEKKCDGDSAFRCLAEAIEKAKKSKILPSAETRFHIAQELATAAYYLLTTGWLHKAINTNNLLLVGSLPSTTSRSSTFPQVKLLGFEFARPDQPGQRSLDPKSNAFLDLYRHPDCRSMARLSEEYGVHGYQKIYDIYSVGVLLFEIGCWRTVENVKKSFDSKRRTGAINSPDFDSYFADKAKSDLIDKVNRAYADAVHRCLTGSFDVGQDDEDGKDLMRRFDETVLQPLIARKKLQADH